MKVWFFGDTEGSTVGAGGESTSFNYLCIRLSLRRIRDIQHLFSGHNYDIAALLPPRCLLMDQIIDNSSCCCWRWCSPLVPLIRNWSHRSFSLWDRRIGRSVFFGTQHNLGFLVPIVVSCSEICSFNTGGVTDKLFLIKKKRFHMFISHKTSILFYHVWP